jgi:glutamate synthase (NADPH/NADH) large chain
VRPEIGSETISLEGYSTIYIGYPIWWGEEPRIMDTFVESYSFDGITMIPFCTSSSSGIGMNGNLAADTFKMICLGASGVFIGKLILQIAGCVGNDFGKCNGCNTGKCPIGITTQNPKLMQRLDVDRVAENIVNYICATDIELKKLLAPVGNSTLPIGRSDALVCVDKNVAERLQIQYSC